MNPILQALMNQLKSKNSNGFQTINTLMKSGGNPEELMKQIIGKLNPEQKQYILNQAKGYGCPDKFLSEIQNMK